MVEVLYISGLVVLALGFALYLYCRWERSKMPTRIFVVSTTLRRQVSPFTSS